MEKRREVVVVTGASGGVGRATALEFARHGAAVGLIARGRAGLAAAMRDVKEAGGRAIELPLDVSDSEALDQAATKVEQRFGPIDIWVNNAMAGLFAEFKDITPAEYRRVTDVTYLGFVWGTMAALRRMRPRNSGTIVQVGSALAYCGIPLQTAYCGAKHAIQGFTESLRCELLHEGSDVWLTMVQMPALNTPQFSWCRTRMPRDPQPVPPIYQPEVAAEAIYWAAHHRRREVYVGAPAVGAIVGNKLAPGLLDHYLARTGFDSQQTNKATRPGADNLFQPADATHDFGAHGNFDDRAHKRSLELWASQHKTLLAGAAILFGALALGGASRNRDKSMPGPINTERAASTSRGRQRKRA
jgi:NAD(P)-dependent dehydrogenase (short-subunit alcohol dehydrogenase family)